MAGMLKFPPFPAGRLLEAALALGLAALLGFALVLLGGFDKKYQVVAVLGGLALGALVLLPERRLLCMLLWVLVMPLSLEKVFYVNAIYEGFVPQAVVVNAADAILLLLAGFLLVESLFANYKVWHWPRFATLFALLLAWAACSAVVHAVFLDSGYVNASGWALLHYGRVLLFIVLVNSAVRTRGELIAILVALMLVVFAQALLVGLSYATGQIYNLTTLLGMDAVRELQTFSTSSGEKMVRGVGTVGHTNQQAAFHTFFTLPLVALLVVRNRWVRCAALLVIGASLVAVLLSFSRSAWLSCALGLAVVALVAWWRREITPGAWFLAASGLVAGALVLGALAEPIAERVFSGDDGATDSRLRMIALAADLTVLHPVIGVGPGEFAEAALWEFPVGFKENEWVPVGERPMVPTVGRLEVVRLNRPGMEPLTSPLPVHNKYLLVLTELGVVGLALWLALYGHLLREGWRSAASRDWVLRYFGLGCLASVVGAASYMMLDLFGDDKSMQVLFFVPALMCAGARIAAGKAPPRSPQPMPS